MSDTEMSPDTETVVNPLDQPEITKRRLNLVATLWVGLPLLVLGWLTAIVWGTTGGILWDDSILLAIHRFSRPQLDWLAVTLTDFGIYKGVIPVVGVLGTAMLVQQRWRSLLYILITITGSALLNRTAKELIHRVRPALWDSHQGLTNYAFPSGHAMSSMTLVAVVVIFTWGGRWRWLTLTLGSLFVALIAWTRMYLGVHYPSDILAGWTMAICWAIATYFIIRPASPSIPTDADVEANQELLDSRQ